MSVSSNTLKDADIIIRHEDRATNSLRDEFNSEYPTVICEVAFTHPNTYKFLSDLLTQWVSSHTTVMIAIGIKIGIFHYLFEFNHNFVYYNII